MELSVIRCICYTALVSLPPAWSQLFNMDAREFIRKLLSTDRPPVITQVIMNLPTDAIEYLGE